MIKFKSLFTAQTVILAVISIFFINSESWATTYYVDATNGNDNDHGMSSTKAWTFLALAPYFSCDQRNRA